MSPTEPAYDAVPLLGTAGVATDEPHHLGEGPMWDPSRERLLWVDIEAGTVHTGRLAGDGRIEPVERIDFPDTAGAVAVAEDGAMVVAGKHRLHYRDLDGNISSGRALLTGDDRRFNDAKPDPAGMLVAGSKGPGGEVLLRIEARENITMLDGDLELSNGLAWTADGRRFFSIDTPTRRIFVRDYSAVTGEVGDREVFLELEHGYPDGMTIDAENHLWVAVFGGGCVLRIAPDGRIVARIDVPAPHTTCPAFAGPDLDTLVITTATEGLDEQRLARYPLSGRLFTFRPGVRGVRPHLWAGR